MYSILTSRLLKNDSQSLFTECMLSVKLCIECVMHHCDRGWQYSGNPVSLKWACAEDTKVRYALVEYIHSKEGDWLLSIIQ